MRSIMVLCYYGGIFSEEEDPVYTGGRKGILTDGDVIFYLFGSQKDL